MKPVHAKPSLYAFYFERLKVIAQDYGYNLVLHGSMNRDLDLIAIPWGETIRDYRAMLLDFSLVLGGSILNESDEDRKRFREKFHGRECWIINLNRGSKETDYLDPQYYIDISIIPHL